MIDKRSVREMGPHILVVGLTIRGSSIRKNSGKNLKSMRRKFCKSCDSLCLSSRSKSVCSNCEHYRNRFFDHFARLLLLLLRPSARSVVRPRSFGSPLYVCGEGSPFLSSFCNLSYCFQVFL